MATRTSPSIAPLIGQPLSRVDGPLKVTGRARYTADITVPGMLHAVPVGATIAAGRLLTLDIDKARAMPGVREVFTRDNIGPFRRLGEEDEGHVDETRPPFDDDVIRYYGQFVALVVATTFEQAVAAARCVQAKYHETTADVEPVSDPDDTPEVDSARGDPEQALAISDVVVDAVYRTPAETHNPIELHATVAQFDGQQYTIHDTTQGVVNARLAIAGMLDVPVDDVRVIMEYLGSGFGSKLWPWTHTLLAAAAARQLQAPVKLVLSRKAVFETAGHRGDTRQRIRLGARRDGTLISLQQDYIYQTARAEAFKENCGEATPYLYSTPNLRVTSAAVRRDVGATTSMRGPGAVPGLWALESAMDELAVVLNMDPLELRVRNEPDIDQSRGVPFSSRHMVECMRRGAQLFGWDKRSAAVGSMSRDGMTLGWGMSACSWMAARQPAQVALSLHADGRVRVRSASQDIGTGTYTVLAQMAADLVGAPLDAIEVVLGDTQLPPGPLSGGSMATASFVPALMAAVDKAFDALLAEVAGEGLVCTRGHVHRDGEPPEDGRRFTEVLSSAGRDVVHGLGSSGASADDEGAGKVSIHSYGAHFAEVTWQREIARLRVSRVVTVIDAGRILNMKTATNQIEGAVMMGIGMALLEQTRYEHRHGAPINSNLADYLVVTHADAPAVEVEFLDYPDTALNALGARGIGEIGIAGLAPAIGNAVHHATGVRARNLPIHIEDLLKAGTPIS